MSLDFPAAGLALLALFDATGIPPTAILPVLYLESGFNPAAVNPSSNCAGVDQLCGAPADYTSWPASQQISQSTTPRFRAIVAKYGPITSAARCYQANLLPATLSSATSTSSVLAAQGSSVKIPGSSLTQGIVYSANSGLDANKDGVITVGDLATKMAQMLANTNVQSAIQQTYALRPGLQPPADPLYGNDFPGSGGGGTSLMNTVGAVLLSAAIVGGAVVAYKYIDGGYKPRWGTNAHSRIRAAARATRTKRRRAYA